MKTLYDIIAGQLFFRGLSQEHLRTIADNAMRTWFESDELIFHDGDLANRFYLIVEGKIALESSVKNGWRWKMKIRRESSRRFPLPGKH